MHLSTITNLLLILNTGVLAFPASQDTPINRTPSLSKRDPNFIAAFTDPNCKGAPIDPPATAPDGELPPCLVFNSHGDYVGINWPSPPAPDNIHVFISYRDDKCTGQVFWNNFNHVDAGKGTQRCLDKGFTNGTWGSVVFT